MTGDRSSGDLDGKITACRAWLAEAGSLLVAYSGGVDSTLLAFLAFDTLGPAHMRAVTAFGAIYPTRETEAARRIAAEIGFPFESVRSHELDDERFAENGPMRCYHCKHELFSRLEVPAEAHGLARVVDVQNLDDARDVRPGTKAA